MALLEGVGCDTGKCVYIEVVDTEGVVRLSDEDEFFNEDDEKVKVDKVFLINWGKEMTKSVERSRNKLLYDSVVRGILETESNLAYDNKKIYLVVLSVWVYECITEHLKDTVFSVSDKSLKQGITIAGYEVKVIEDLNYSEPIQYIIN